jgi:hypothetical protein
MPFKSVKAKCAMINQPFLPVFYKINMKLIPDELKPVNERWHTLYKGRTVVIPDPFLFQYEEENSVSEMRYDQPAFSPRLL